MIPFGILHGSHHNQNVFWMIPLIPGFRITADGVGSRTITLKSDLTSQPFTSIDDVSISENINIRDITIYNQSITYM